MTVTEDTPAARPEEALRAAGPDRTDPARGVGGPAESTHRLDGSRKRVERRLEAPAAALAVSRDRLVDGDGPTQAACAEGRATPATRPPATRTSRRPVREESRATTSTGGLPGGPVGTEEGRGPARSADEQEESARRGSRSITPRPKRIDQIEGYRTMLEIDLKRGTCLPLLPRHEMYLWVLQGDGRRFVAVFRQTWSRLPLRARRRLLKHWKNSGHTSGVELSPNVYLSDLPIDDEERNLACVGHSGHRLNFRSSALDAMPDDVVQDLIAHELAHVLQNAHGIHCIEGYVDGRAIYATEDGEIFGGNLEIELDADWTMESWGFDPESIDRWSLATGRSKEVEVDLIESLERLYRFGR